MPLCLPQTFRESSSSYKTKDKLLYIAHGALYFVAFILFNLTARPLFKIYVPEVMIDFMCLGVPYCITLLHELFAQHLFHLVNFCLFFKTLFMIGDGCFMCAGVASLIR